MEVDGNVHRPHFGNDYFRRRRYSRSVRRCAIGTVCRDCCPLRAAVPVRLVVLVAFPETRRAIVGRRRKGAAKEQPLPDLACLLEFCEVSLYPFVAYRAEQVVWCELGLLLRSLLSFEADRTDHFVHQTR